MTHEAMKLNQRPIPEAALRDGDAVEMLRVWIAEQRLHCSMKIGMYRETTNIPEEKAWGTILADSARHVANALEAGSTSNASESLQKIRDAFIRELGAPTSEVTGDFVLRH
ncbi:DUF5076 domain-containing protein [Variovorax sp. LARHSF232]